MRKWSWRLIAGVAAALVVVAIIHGFWPEPIEVDSALVTLGPLVVTIEDEGKLRVRDRFTVAAPIAGEVSRIELDPGDQVARGATVATVRPSRSPLLDPKSQATAAAALRSALDSHRQSESAVAQATALLDGARKKHERTGSLVKEGVASAQELDAALAERQALEARLRAAKFAAQVAAHQVTSARVVLVAAGRPATPGAGIAVTSPIDGTVLKVLQESEGPVNPGTPLVELGDLGSLEVVADLLTRDAARVRPGMRALLESWGGDQALQARVRTIEPSAVTRVSPLGVREQRVNVVLDLLPTAEWLGLGDGYAAQVHVVIFEAERVLKVPRSALFRHRNGWALFTVRDGRANLASVRVGQQSSTDAEIIGGLQEGDRVILHPSDAVREGAAVKVLDAPPSAPLNVS